jgi:hypothetical protein
MASTSYSSSPPISSGGGRVKFGPFSLVSWYGWSSEAWKTSWIPHDTGKVS